MGRNYKMALALLYVLQLVVVFRESVAEVYKHAVEALHGTSAHVESVDAGHAPTTETRQPAAPHGPLWRARPAVDAIFLVGIPVIKDEGHEPHHHEREDRTRKPRQRHINEYLIANLFNRMKRLWPPGVRDDRPSSPARWLTYPAAA